MQSPDHESNTADLDHIQKVMNPTPAQDDDPQPIPSNPSLLLVHSTVSETTSAVVRTGSTEGKSRPTVKRGLRCRRCQEEMSTKEALKLHTCYSIMDKTITAEGNTTRKKVVQEKLENGPASIRAKKTPVKKKPNSIMRIKDKLLSSKRDPEVATAPSQRPRLAPEQEHGSGTLVVRFIRRLYLKHPAPASWILDRDTSLVGVRICAVKIRRVVNDAVMEDTKKVSLIEEESDDSEFDVIIDKDSGLASENVMKKAGVSNDDSFEATNYSCSSSSGNISFSSVLADKTTDVQAAVRREDPNTRKIVNQHIVEAIERVVHHGGKIKNKAKNIDASNEVKPNKSNLEIGPASTKVKKIQVKKKRLSKKANSNMRIKDKLLSSKRDPEAAAAPIQFLVTRCIRRLYLKHPTPVSWILDRDTSQMGIRSCAVKIRRLDRKRTKQILTVDLNDASREDTEEILDQEICLTSEDVLKEIAVRNKLLIPSAETSPVLADKNTDAQAVVRREDLREVVSQHTNEAIETVVQDSRKNEDIVIDVSTEKVKSHKSKDALLQTNATKKPCGGLSIKSIVMKARRKNNCLVRVKKLSSEEIKWWTAGKSRDGDLWSTMSKACTDRKKIKSSVPLTKSKSRKLSLKTVVNHFKEYDATVLDSSEEDFGKEDLLPPINYTKKQTGFRIPKFSPKKVPEVPLTSYEARAKDIVKTGGQVMSVRGFLAKEKIETDASVEQFMQEGGGEAEFGNMFDRIKVLRTKESSKSYRTEDKMEMNDIKHKDWDCIKRLTTDMERKKLAQDQFKNTVSSDPAVNLSFHGFRRKNARSQLEFGTDWIRVAPFQSFAIMGGEMEPLQGYQRKDKTEIETETGPKDHQSGEAKKSIKLSHFAQVMKSLFYKKYARNLGAKKASQHEFDDFRAYLSHYKTGQEETLNFLSFYKENVTLDSEQTDEVMDIENQYSTFSNYYGQAETTFCSVCVTKHKFCQ